jgi:hypothetical protein
VLVQGPIGHRVESRQQTAGPTLGPGVVTSGTGCVDSAPLTVGNAVGRAVGRAVNRAVGCAVGRAGGRAVDNPALGLLGTRVHARLAFVEPALPSPRRYRLAQVR